MKVCCRCVPHQLTWQTQNDTPGVKSEVSSALRRAWWSILKQNFYRAWWSILKQNFYRRWDLRLALHFRELNQWCRSILDHQSKRSSRQCNLQGHEYWCFLRWSSVGHFHTSQLNNKYSCLLGHSKETQGSCLAKETRMLTRVDILLHQT